MRFFIAGKDSTQEEFYYTFNNLYEQGKQIVLTSDRTPGDMPTLEERLKGRFGEGVMVRINPPDQETRALIIEEKARSLHLSMSDEIVRFLAEKLSDNVRQIEGALRKICAMRDLSGMKLTFENVAQTIADLRTQVTKDSITPDLIIRCVCRYYGVEESQLTGKSRSKNVSEPRQVAMHLIRKTTAMSHQQIGHYFHRDRTTAKYAIETIESILALSGNDMESKLKEIMSNIETGV